MAENMREVVVKGWGTQQWTFKVYNNLTDDEVAGEIQQMMWMGDFLDFKWKFKDEPDADEYDIKWRTLDLID